MSILAVIAASRRFSVAGQPAPVATTVTISGSTSVAVGSTTQLTATVRDQYGAAMTGQTIAWGSSSNPVATVDGTGRVTGQGVGTATITATSGSAAGTVDVAVSASAPAPLVKGSASASGGDSRVTITWTAPTGGTAPYAYDLYESNTAGGLGSLLDSSVTSPYADTGLPNDGTPRYYTVRALDSAGGSVDYTQVSATPAVSTVSSVVVASWKATIPATGHLQLKATPKDVAGNAVSGQTIAWSSSDESIATVDSTGELIGVAAGTVTISGVAAGVTGTKVITITPSTNVPALKAQPRSVLTYVAGASTLHCDADQSSIPTGIISTEQFDLYTGRPGYGGTLVTSSGSQAFGTGHDFTGLADNPLAWVRCTVGDGTSSDTTDLFAPIEAPITPWARDQFDSGDLTYTNTNGFSWHGGSNVVSNISRFGDYSHEFSYAGSGAEGGWGTTDFEWHEQRFTIGGEHKELWFEKWVYYPDGTENLDSAAYYHRKSQSSNNNKFLQVWGGGSVSNENASYYVKFLHESEMMTTGVIGSEFMGFKYGTNASFGGKVVASYEFNGQTNGAKPSIDVSKDLGMWHCHRFWMKISDIGMSNGAEKYWLDGVRKVNATGLPNDPVDGDPAKGLVYGYIQGAPNSGFDELTRVYVGSLAIYTSDPGWT